MRLPRCILILAIVIPASIAQAADHLSVDIAPGALRAFDADGALVWRIQTPAESDPVITSMGNGGLVVDDAVVSPGGAIIARRDPADVVPGPIEAGGPAGCPYWEEPAVVTPPPGGGADTLAPLLVDSSGNAWAINRNINSGNDALRVRTFDRIVGVWGPLVTLTDATYYVEQPEGAIDGDDNLTIVFRDIDQGYRMYSIRHEPGIGWGPLTPIYATPTFFQAVEVAADADGDVIVINDFGQVHKAVRCVFYDASSGTWGSPAQVSPTGYDTLLPTLAQNKAGTAIYLVYMVRTGGPPGLYGHKWNSAANTWGPAEFLPGSQAVSFAIATGSSRFPLTVGGDGEASILWQTRSPYTVNASRTQGGSWLAPHEILPPGPDAMNVENFADIDANAEGDVIGAFTRWEGSNHFYSFRYDHANGWREAVNPYTSSVNYLARVRVAFYSGARAMATFLGSQGDQRQLTSSTYDGLDWAPDLLDIPQVHDAFFQRVIADRTEVLLAYKAEQSGTNIGYKGSWLRNTVGDLDCDGVVGIDDFADYLDCVTGPGVSTGPACRAADLDGDGDADAADLAIMQRVFGR